MVVPALCTLLCAKGPMLFAADTGTIEDSEAISLCREEGKEDADHSRMFYPRPGGSTKCAKSPDLGSLEDISEDIIFMKSAKLGRSPSDQRPLPPEESGGDRGKSFPADIGPETVGTAAVWPLLHRTIDPKGGKDLRYGYIVRFFEQSYSESRTSLRYHHLGWTEEQVESDWYVWYATVR